MGRRAGGEGRPQGQRLAVALSAGGRARAGPGGSRGAAGADRCGHAGPHASTVNRRDADEGAPGTLDPRRPTAFKRGKTGAASGRGGAAPMAETGYCPVSRRPGQGRARRLERRGPRPGPAHPR